MRLALIGLVMAIAACQAPAPPLPTTSNASPVTTSSAVEPSAPRTATPSTAAVSSPRPGPTSPTPTEVPDLVITALLGDRAWQTSRRELGLRPAAIGGLTIDPVAPGLDDFLRKVAADVLVSPRDARLRIVEESGTFEFTPGLAGATLDVDASRSRLARAAVEGLPSLELVTGAVQPRIDDAMFVAARDQLGRMFPSAQAPPVTLRWADKKWELDKVAVAKMVALKGFDQPGARVELIVDELPAHELVGRMAKEIDQASLDARFEWNGGNLKPLRQAVAGRQLDAEATLAWLRGGFLQGERTFELPVKVLKPAVAVEDAKALGIVEPIERASTPLGGAIPEKRHNVKLAAERLNGVVVPPGATFSFNKEVGPTTVESGFKWGFGITTDTDGIRTVPSVAGGICQVATTLFQPVFWAGYRLEERYWHLYWIPSYVSRDIVGLDVTVDEEHNLDFKWINVSDSHVLIQAEADDSKVTFALYGKKPKWSVKVDPAKVTNRQQPDTRPVVEQEPTLAWGRTIVVEAAREGFDVEVVRTVNDGGAEARVLTLKSTYQPSRNVTLVGTAGIPPGVSVEDALARTAAAANATPVPAASPASNRPAPTATRRPGDPTPIRPVATPTPAPAKPAGPTATPAPAKPTAPSKPKP